MNIRRKKRTTPQIPIVALVDILVIVLLFIVATTTFRDKQPQTQMKINLPQSAGLGGNPAVKETRTTLAVTTDRKIMLDGAEVTADKLSEALAALKEQNPKIKLELQADKETPLGLLVRIWDSLKAAGIPINDVPARIQRSSAAAVSASPTAP